MWLAYFHSDCSLYCLKYGTIKHENSTITLYYQNRRDWFDDRGCQALSITQPSLSNAVRDLENEMGIRYNEILRELPYTWWDGVFLCSVVEQTQLQKNAIRTQSLIASFLVSSQHERFLWSMLVSLLKKSDMEKYELFLQWNQNFGRSSTTSRTSEVKWGPLLAITGTFFEDVNDNHLVAHHLYSPTSYLCQQDQPLLKEIRAATDRRLHIWAMTKAHNSFLYFSEEILSQEQFTRNPSLLVTVRP